MLSTRLSPRPSALCVIHHGEVQHQHVRDDTMIYTTGSRPNDVMMKIQEDVQIVEQWIKSSQLVLI